MPARLSPSRPASPKATSPPHTMSLTEMSRPVSETRHRHPTLPYMSGTPLPRNLHEATFSASPRVLPPLQTRQPSEPGHSARRRDPNPVLHPVNYGQQGPKSPLGRTAPHYHYPPSFSPATSTTFEQYAVIGCERRSGAGSSPLEPIIKRGDSEEVSYFNRAVGTLPAPTCKQMSPDESVRGSPDVALHQRLRDLPPRGDVARQMGISSLINGNDSSSSLVYDIVIRQQPIAARACGFGDRDRRVIDPPPILQMLVRDSSATPSELNTKMRYPFSVIHCELWNAQLDQEETSMPEVGERSSQRRLMGTLVASPFVGCDENAVEGCFFPFPDLSCRTSGKFRLRFVLVVLNPSRMKAGDSLPFRATLLSDVFEVYPAKTFPGMVPSTELARRLKEQGCLISVKKGHQRIEVTGDRRVSGGNEGDVDATSPGKGRAKRQKT